MTFLKIVTLPYSMVMAQFAILTKGKPNEVHPKDAQLSGVRKVAFSKPLLTTEIRKKLKEKRVSLTDYIIVSA